MNKSGPSKARDFRWTDDDEPFSSISSFHHIRLTDKIRALRVINDLQSKTSEDYLKKLKEKNALEVSKLEGKDKSAYYDYSAYISLYAAWEKNSNKIQRPTDRDAITAMNIQSPKVIHMIHKETEMYNHRENVRRAYKEMLLVYLIIIC